VRPAHPARDDAEIERHAGQAVLPAIRWKDVLVMTVLVPRRTRQVTGAPMRRWDPATEIQQIQDRMNQLLQGVFGDVAAAGVPVEALLPPTDIEDTDDAFLVEIDLPNVRAEDVNVELRDNELRITGEYKARERTGVLRRQNRRMGEFEYVIAVPGEVNPEGVEATLRDGVLTVRLPKATANQPRRIEVRESSGDDGTATTAPGTTTTGTTSRDSGPAAGQS
jgi:HSP20 family protein